MYIIKISPPTHTNSPCLCTRPVLRKHRSVIQVRQVFLVKVRCEFISVISIFSSVYMSSLLMLHNSPIWQPEFSCSSWCASANHFPSNSGLSVNESKYVLLNCLYFNYMYNRECKYKHLCCHSPSFAFVQTHQWPWGHQSCCEPDQGHWQSGAFLHVRVTLHQSGGCGTGSGCSGQAGNLKDTKSNSMDQKYRYI